MLKVGFIGWRGMVGSVLMSRMIESKDFDDISPTFFSTSQVGQQPTGFMQQYGTLQDAYSVDQLSKMDILLSCQGGEYTKEIHPKLRAAGWKGFWIDAASTLRLDKESILVLDPLNHDKIVKAINEDKKDFIGSNCTVSLMSLAIAGLFKGDLVEWVNSSTYQAISGAGAAAMQELLQQTALLSNADNVNEDILVREKTLRELSKDSSKIPQQKTAQTLAYNLLPWIDVAMPNGQTKEEYKAATELNKILDTKKIISVDGVCARVPSLRSHSQALTIKLRQKLTIDEIKQKISQGNEWIKVIDNNKEDTLKYLTPQATSGTLDIAIGRIKPSLLADDIFHCFTVGDQLLWGAAEPLRRALNIIKDRV
ncbi:MULTISPECIES: aspartate-semialdehyde dehydrogenase [Francisella]|uniref:Aspartate-semialdehyde dehydrogenase n=1 Tax=Francisella opportunistica TaxID=2016517 RepID=A0A345JSE3_9GAMM|nr:MULTISPECIES: aspartate-semialdehyde dehydrogenase [Francisella]APC92004.1 Aspartate-semialdehyde dehydrogenase [Francisella sp. MA067296]AXH30239.1 aspartate-semialdehyde dehydrogenase [Francisella opportunistica]AXH31880.1 aspartate-semialdehyde dehydrogenase [Francisella opportunistica]AXH33526.1 aspartate-semialdehyde dehydrogenase [Francisella opportunistica]